MQQDMNHSPQTHLRPGIASIHDFWQKNNTLQTLVKDNACVVCEFNGNNMSNRIETSLNDELLSEMFGNDEIKLIEEK